MMEQVYDVGAGEHCAELEGELLGASADFGRHRCKEASARPLSKRDKNPNSLVARRQAPLGPLHRSDPAKALSYKFDDLPNPGHLLCAALAACMDSTVRMIADRLGVRLERLEVEVNGHADVRGCLAMSRSVRPGFRQMQCRLALELDPGLDPQVGAMLVRQTEKLRVILDTLRNGTPIAVDFEVAHPAHADLDAAGAQTGPRA